jgi:hypothetical protein
MCPHAYICVLILLYMSSCGPYYGGGGEVAVLFHASGLVFAMVLISFDFIFIFYFSTRRDQFWRWCLYVYTYMYICMYVCMYLCMYVCMYVCMCVCVCVCVCVYIYIYIYI